MLIYVEKESNQELSNFCINQANYICLVANTYNSLQDMLNDIKIILDITGEKKCIPVISQDTMKNTSDFHEFLSSYKNIGSGSIILEEQVKKNTPSNFISVRELTSIALEYGLNPILRVSPFIELANCEKITSQDKIKYIVTKPCLHENEINKLPSNSIIGIPSICNYDDLLIFFKNSPRSSFHLIDNKHSYFKDEIFDVLNFVKKLKHTRIYVKNLGRLDQTILKLRFTS